jgi:hypothetical protein
LTDEVHAEPPGSLVVSDWGLLGNQHYNGDFADAQLLMALMF